MGLILFGVIVAGTITTLALQEFRNKLKQDARDQLLSVASIQQQRVSTFLERMQQRAKLIASHTQLRQLLEQYNRSLDSSYRKEICLTIEDIFQSLEDFDEIKIVDADGITIMSTNPDSVGIPELTLFDSDLSGNVSITEKSSEGRLYLHTITPLLLNGRSVGTLHINSNLNELRQITASYDGLGESGETILAEQLDNGDARFLTPLRFDENRALSRTIAADRTDVPIIRALAGETGWHEDIVDYREVPVVAVTTQIPEQKWGLLVKMDQNEVYHSYEALRSRLLQLLIFVAFAGLIVAYFMASRIGFSLKRLTHIAETIRQGDTTVDIDQNADRFDQEGYILAKTIQQMTREILQTFDAAPSGMVVTNRYGTIVRCNAAAESLFGYDSGELVGQPVEVLISESQREQHIGARKRYVEEARKRPMGSGRELFGLTKRGEMIPVEVGLSPITYGNEEGILATVVDISSRIQLQQERLRLEQERMDARDEFMASMSHELRTPLTSIIGNAEYLSERLSSPDLKKIVDDIETAGTAQLNLVNDILDMSKIESGKYTIDEIPFNLSRLLENIEGMLAIRVQDAGLTLEIVEQNHEVYELIGDSNRISQILINLIGNAIKFTEQGGIKLTTMVENGYLRFDIEDTGIGMSTEEQSRLFQKFEQADGSISRRFGGSGLGLYISFNLAQMMGGNITAKSNKGSGSTFTLTIPYRRSDFRIVTDQQQQEQSTTYTQMFKGHVLIVEDTAALRLLERRILEGKGISVTTAENGQEAVELATHEPFDMILMDMQMPVMDGIEATRILRKRGIDTPIYALTANVMAKHREQFEQAGCNGFLAKPIDKNALVDALKKHLPQDQAASDNHQTDAMKMIIWSDHYFVGHPVLDLDHQRIVEHINLLIQFCNREEHAPDRERVLKALSDLHDMMMAHVEREEALLEQANYPELDRHRAGHREYWDKLSDLYRNQLGDQQIISITNHLISWWEHHILTDDMAFKEYVSALADKEE